jgi:hypothetical protein
MLVGTMLRVVGLSRGDSDFVLPANADAGVTVSFHHFHPDEETLLDAAQRLGDPLAPPLTAYGTLPLYAARAATATASWWAGTPTDLGTVSGLRRSVLAVRTLAVALSLATLAVLWLFGRRFFDVPTAVLAVALAATPPLALQDAHFFTVDGLFTLLALLALLANGQRPGSALHEALRAGGGTDRAHGCRATERIVNGPDPADRTPGRTRRHPAEYPPMAPAAIREAVGCRCRRGAGRARPTTLPDRRTIADDAPGLD